MLVLPKHSKGLDWIFRQGTSQLLLIPGLQTASLVAAATGDAEALAYLRFTAQHHAAVGSRNNTPLDEICSAACRLSTRLDHEQFSMKLEQNREEAQVFKARRWFTERLMLKAAAEGQLAALQWLQALCHPLWDDDDEEIIQAAAEHGQLHVLKHLCSSQPVFRWPEWLLTMAASHEDCLAWLLSQEQPCPFDDDTLIAVAAAGNLPALQHLRLHHQDYMPLTAWNEDVTCSAARSGRLAVVQWLRGRLPPVPWHGDICRAAAERGDLAMLKLVRSLDPPAPWDACCTAAAAKEGHLSTLQWLHAAGCPWDASATTDAAWAGRLDILQWLRAQVPAAPWTHDCTQAAAGKNLATLQWLLAQTPPCPLHPSCSQAAARRGDLPMLEVLIRHGCMLTGLEYCGAARHDSVRVLRWLHQKQVPVPGPSQQLWADMEIDSCVYGPVSRAALLFLGDIGLPMHPEQQAELALARKAYCTFYGLLRWCRSAVSDPSRGINEAFDGLAKDASGQSLLVRLCMLPPEILNKIALAAGLRHNLFEASDADDHLHPARHWPLLDVLDLY